MRASPLRLRRVRRRWLRGAVFGAASLRPGFECGGTVGAAYLWAGRRAVASMASVPKDLSGNFDVGCDAFMYVFLSACVGFRVTFSVRFGEVLWATLVESLWLTFFRSQAGVCFSTVYVAVQVQNSELCNQEG